MWEEVREKAGRKEPCRAWYPIRLGGQKKKGRRKHGVLCSGGWWGPWGFLTKGTKSWSAQMLDVWRGSQPPVGEVGVWDVESNYSWSCIFPGREGRSLRVLSRW